MKKPCFATNVELSYDLLNQNIKSRRKNRKMMNNLSTRFIYKHFRRRSIFTLLTILSIGVIFTIIGSYVNSLYDVFFSICLGLFIGGIIMSIISTILAEISTHDLQGTDHIDHFDHIDHIDHADVGQIDHID
ncbi:MAG: hypothetical protein ACFFE4_19665, partial [Candidatus Thorarchaeota archaeon]